MKKPIKIFLIFLSVSLLLLLAIALSAFLKYRSIKSSSLPEIIVLSPDKESKFNLGDKIVLFSDLECDWTVSPKRVKFSIPEGLQEIPERNFSLKKIRWGKWTWRISFTLQAFRPGEYPAIDGVAEFWSANAPLVSKIKTSSFAIDEIQVNENDEINVAGKIEGRKFPFKSVLTALIILILIAAIAMFAWRRKTGKTVSSLPPWCIALDLLRELRISQEHGLLATQICVAKLTDIIRNYLEKRFNIDAPTMTTEEFLEGLGRSDSPLPLEHKNFLSDFMQSAELVKFANMPAESQLVEKAISDAERLVKSSVPREEIPGSDGSKEAK
ncbi:MAG TPA: hypothetical protein PK821_04410 [Victivallales bacterium]|nr:hypothetical protein [Victivallales bacterium]